jgi:hypothetical protein
MSARLICRLAPPLGALHAARTRQTRNRPTAGFAVAVLAALAVFGPRAEVVRAAPTVDDSLALPILQRFLALDDPTPSEIRALRHLDARNEHFDSDAWMDVWTEIDRAGFRYRIVSEGGSDYIRSRVFKASLETERKMWADGTPDRASFTLENYTFGDAGPRAADGLAPLSVKPRRKDALLVEGRIFLNPEDADLVRVEGRLVKSPSFWTRRVEIVKWFRRINGFRMPVALESVASILIAGKSTLRVTYDYESVNGHRVGSPQPRLRLAEPAPPNR